MKKYLFLLLCSFHASAVYINHKGLGQVLLVPYYTVNNDLNTNISITNTTDLAKAIKVNFREGLNGDAVLSYNVYLDANDTWTFVLVGGSSTVVGFESKDSVLQYSSDNSCTPYLVKFGQEFLPFQLVGDPTDLSRAREGFIEIIEMGVLENDFALAADQGTVGVPEDCSEFEAAWQVGGVWHEESGGNPSQDLSPVTGGLMAEVDIINVLEGINYSVPVVALDGFFAAESINHTSPGDTILSLDAAEPVAHINANGKIYNLSFNTGYDAVSAVFMADELFVNYAIDDIVAGKSEAVFIQPTRRFYFENSPNIMSAPYQSGRLVANCSVANYGGTETTQTIYDRESQIELPSGGNVGGVPRPPNKAICGSVFVRSIGTINETPSQPKITLSNNYDFINSVPLAHATENGLITTRFEDTRPLVGADIDSGQSIHLMGLPIIGISLQQYTNGGAAAGLLAQYGGSHKVKSNIRVIEQ